MTAQEQVSKALEQLDSVEARLKKTQRHRTAIEEKERRDAERTEEAEERARRGGTTIDGFIFPVG